MNIKYLINAAIMCMVVFSLVSCLDNNDKDEIEALSKQQDQEILEFLQIRDVQYQKTEKGTYLVNLKDGVGNNVPKEDSLTVELLYSLSVFEGISLIENQTLLYNPKIGAFVGGVVNNNINQFDIQGIHDAAQLMKKGGKAKAFIPGLLGFGSVAPTFNNSRIPSFAILVSELSVVDIRTDSVQAIIERDSIQSYANRKGYEIVSEWQTGLIKLKLLRQGNTALSKPKSNSTVSVDYKLFSTNDELYDSGTDASFELGKGNLIKGFEEAVINMFKEEKAIFALPSRLAYKARGTGSIKPYEILIYEITLDNITNK